MILDLVVTNFADNTVSVFLGNGKAVSKRLPPIPSATDLLPSSLEISMEMVLDLAVANQNDHSVSILLKGDGNFQTELAYQAGTTDVAAVAR